MARINSLSFPMSGLSPTSPSTTTNTTNGANTSISGFPLTYPRPQWLFSREELEELLSSFEIKLSELRTNKNNSALVERVLGRILADRENENTFPGYKVENGTGLNYQPDNFELLLARLHLAIEIQSILVDWCTRGMEETRKTSYLGRNDMNGGGGSARFDAEISGEAVMQTPATDGRLRRSTSESSTASTDVASESPNTTLTTPSSSAGGDRASKRRNLGDGDHCEVQGPPRLSLVTTESVLPTIHSATSYQFPDSASTCTSAKRRWGEGVYSGSAGYTMTPSSALFSAHPLSVGQSVMSMNISPATSTSDKTPYYCPYYLMNSNNDYHKDCATKTYPNPRKLKEHVWRYTRPFRCEKCGEGFGRDKTRAIHKEKKTPCKPRPATEYDEGTGIYEGSREQLRDRKIETAKSTFEIMNILREYEQGIAVNSTTAIIANQAPNQIPTAPMMFPDPFSGHQKQQPDLHAMTQAQAPYLHGLGLDLAGTFDTNVPKIIVQPALTCEMLANTQYTNYLTKSTLEGQGWKPIELQHPTTPPMKQQRQQTHTRNLQQGTLSPPTQQDPASRANLRMSTPKSPTPELTHNGPSPMPSPMSIQDGDDHDNVIYESPLSTPSINITYWRADSQKSQSSTPTEPIIAQEQVDILPLSQPSLPQQARTMSLNGSVPSMGMQRRTTAGSLDQLAYNLLEDIESSWWDNSNCPYRY